MLFRRLVLVIAAASALSLVAVSGPGAEGTGAPARRGSVAGQLLVASPDIGDPRFARTVIFMVRHSPKGAFGLVINRAYGSGPLGKLLKGFGIESDSKTTVTLHYGGPVERGAAFVLHTADYAGPSTTVVNHDFAMSYQKDVFEAVAKGKGPRRILFALGYAGWGPGQLESEFARKDWTTAPATEELVFSNDLDSLWERASAMAGLPL